MQKEATAKAQETILEKQREDESQFYQGGNTGIYKQWRLVSSYVHLKFHTWLVSNPSVDNYF